jgi:hypothetical protein
MTKTSFIRVTKTSTLAFILNLLITLGSYFETIIEGTFLLSK